ncbi:MAG: quinolinate synthase NadA [Megasphaera sp.]|jgi:quinolinate synthase|nr:quinolinate synthase NadA [Megasphaera sp.]MCH4187812.1 quinolinate synthase NadA [Megasphaera sp.]MCH4218015.1 quinolinate synthase NadA [Megasphaera sp.]
MADIVEEIYALKKEKHAIILAHYYVPDEVQEIADYVGDSFFLSKKAKETDAEIIVFAGVLFMGESAKMLNPQKKVLMPDRTADCPMAHMGTVASIAQARAAYDDLAVVCYINSTTALKAASDVCVTSSNAVTIVKKLPNHHIFFTPDRNLGHYVASQVPDKHFIYNNGFCPRHESIEPAAVTAAKAAHPEALFLAHPECRPDVLAMADYIGSTSGIIQYASASAQREFIIGTEEGVFYELTTANPHKQFYPVMGDQYCINMKKVTLDKVRNCLRDETNEVTLDETIRRKAVGVLDKMLELAK